MPRRGGVLLGLWWYLGALTAPRIVLWCYFIWWAFTATRYFDPNPRLWLTSLGISAIIGTGLYLSTALGGKAVTRLDGFQIARLYMMPFCVSSFAALIKDRGFILVFHPTVDANVECAGLCLVFVAVALLARVTTRGRGA